MLGTLSCPSCHQPLAKHTSSHGVFWYCETCGGKALGIEVLRRTFARDQINAVWQRTVSGQGSAGRACPSCRNATLEVAATDEPQPRIDVCRLCHFVWFDADELARFTPLPPRDESSDPEMTAAEKQARAIRKVEELGRRSVQGDWNPKAPEHFWEILGMLFRVVIH